MFTVFFFLCLFPDSSYLDQNESQFEYTSSNKEDITALDVQAGLTNIESSSMMPISEFKFRYKRIESI
ncbi:MAG: hypothetical protein HAW62_00665 [Endozoicomonadaceae bacterium]|nr:hypothetical protein [Endozoicomonadaceae bacterium]